MDVYSLQRHRPRCLEHTPSRASVRGIGRHPLSRRGKVISNRRMRRSRSRQHQGTHTDGETTQAGLWRLLVPRCPLLPRDASADRIQALTLNTFGLSTSAYSWIGIASRIAFSLGLHLDRYPDKHGRVSKERSRRLWWTLVMVDMDISLRLGRPCMVAASADDSWLTPLPSEQVSLPSGSVMVVSLTRG